ARLCHTFGPGAKKTDDRAHAEFARKAAAGEEIVLNSAGSQLRSYNYIVDSVSGILTVLLKGISRAAYDICSPGNTVTIRELAGLFAKVGGTEVVVKEPDEKQKALQSPISKQVLDSSRLEALGWSKAYELEDAVNNYVKILRG
ncbi:MAG: NAD(P)-dependent oxidoreductase, partial [Butyrivibrio sp.]|nr:NAD(P)-dependent oxidoreductase [Butyrivibrio sp.]